MNTEIPRILIISPGHPALAAGCAEMAAYDLFRDLNQSGQAEASFLGCVRAQQHPAPSDCTLHPVRGMQDEYLLHVDDFDNFMLAHGIDSRSLDDFGQFLDTINPDLIHFHHLNLIGAESLAVVRNRLPRARIVFTLHDFHPICHRGGLMTRTRSDDLCEEGTPEGCHGCFNEISPERFSLRSQHFQNMLGLVDRFIAPSIFLRQRFCDWGIPEPLIDWIPGGLPESVRAVEDADRVTRNRFGFFGNIAPHKGPLLLLDALKHLDPAIDLTLTLHGSVQDQSNVFCEAFDQALKREGERARYQGPYSRRNIAALMADVDWVIVPSNWWEVAPLTILESFHLGRPVIAGDAGGMAELVDDGVTGLLFRHNDAADLAKMMEMAACDLGRWQQMAASLPAVPTMADVTLRHLALYDDLLTRSHRKIA